VSGNGVGFAKKAADFSIFCFIHSIAGVAGVKGLTHHPDISEFIGFYDAPGASDASKSLRFVFIFVFALTSITR
jgi:hypothetical protein